MKYLRVTAFALASLVSPAQADISERDLESLKGFTIIGAYTVTGFLDEKGKRSDDFEGCDFDRRIILDDQYIVTCNEYGYKYAYRPKAIIFGDGSTLRMLVAGRIYRVTKG